MGPHVGPKAALANAEVGSSSVVGKETGGHKPAFCALLTAAWVASASDRALPV